MKSQIEECQILSLQEIQDMMLENEKDRQECQQVTESTYRGESYYWNDGRPGEGKIKNERLAFYKEVLYRDMKTDGFHMTYPHGTVISQGKRNHYYRGEVQIFEASVPSLYRPDPNKIDDKIFSFVSDMRVEGFRLFIRRFDFIHQWEKC